MRAIKILMLIGQVASVFSLPSIQKCKLTDSACMKASAQAFLPTLAAGIPELNTEVLDVMNIDKIKIDIAGLNLDMRDVKVGGVRNAIIDKIGVNMEKKKINVVYHCDIIMKGQYKASGRLLILPISGDGDFAIKIKRIEISMTMPFELKKNDAGQDLLDLKSFKYKYDIIDNAHFHLSNLFNGNKLLSDAMLKFMNENWKLISQEFGSPLLDKSQDIIFKNVKTFLNSQILESITEN